MAGSALGGRFFLFAGIALLVAVLRFFLRALLAPTGIPVWIGSLFCSLWIVLGVALFYFFGTEGKAPRGRYLAAALWFLALAAWVEVLVIAGILISGAFNWPSYYRGPFETVIAVFPTPAAHAIGHVQGFFFRAAVWLVLGGILYLMAKRRRSAAEG